VANSILSLRGKANSILLLVAVLFFFAALASSIATGPLSIPAASVHAQALQTPSVCDAAVPNPLAVATLRWYSRNQVAQFPMPPRSSLLSMAFDGSNMNVLAFSDQANSSTSAVIFKVRAADGAVLATFTNFPSLEFSGFGQTLFDGEDLFVQFIASDDSGVLKFRASDGAPLGAFSMGLSGQPFGDMIFDGRDIWIASAGAGVTRFRANTLQATGGFSGGDPQGLAFDGRNVWVTNLLGFVEVHRGSDGALVHSIPMPGEPYGIAFDGVNMWVTNSTHNTITKIRAHDFVDLGTFPTESTPTNVVFDGANIWAMTSRSVTVLRACDGTRVGTFATAGTPRFMAFDGINVWVGLQGAIAKM